MPPSDPALPTEELVIPPVASQIIRLLCRTVRDLPYGSASDDEELAMAARITQRTNPFARLSLAQFLTLGPFSNG